MREERDAVEVFLGQRYHRIVQADFESSNNSFVSLFAQSFRVVVCEEIPGSFL